MGHFAAYIRPENKEEVDGQVKFPQEGECKGKYFMLTVEAKNHEAGFGSELFQEVMQRVKHDVNLLIIVTPSAIFFPTAEKRKMRSSPNFARNDARKRSAATSRAKKRSTSSTPRFEIPAHSFGSWLLGQT